MGIDIFLNGYEAYAERIKPQKSVFDNAVKWRDSLPENSTNRKAAQEAVNIAYEAMITGRVGYIRSSYNSMGLFNVLEELFGVDVGALLFSEDWDHEVPISAEDFLANVTAMYQTAALAMSQGKHTLPWLEEYTDITGKRAPDPHPARIFGEEFGRSVLALCQEAGFDTGAQRPAQAVLNADHRWYLTTGLCNLREFGELALQMEKQGRRPFAVVSY